MPLPLTTFKMYAPTLIASRTTDGRLRIEGVASSTVKDYHGDQITLKALQKMAGSALGMTIFMNHDYKVPGDVFGTVEKALVVNTGQIDKKSGEPIYDMRFGIGVASSNPQAVKTYELIETDKTKLGLSIGAMVPEGGASFDKVKSAYVVDDAELVETSVIGIPASPRAWVDYVVKAFSGHYPDRLNAESRLKIAQGLPEDASSAPDEDEGSAGGEHPDEAEEHDDTVEEDEDDPLLKSAGEDVAFGSTHFEASFTPEFKKESWSSAYKNSLPDSAFACPKQRKYPHHDKSGAVDRGHLAAALSRHGDPGNDQCGAAHLEAHARSIGLGDREKGLTPDLIKTGGQHPHAHLHEHEHEHGYGDSVTVHNHEHAHLHSHDHPGDHEHADDMNNWEHDHSHGGETADHPHDETGTATGGTVYNALEPEITKTHVTVWETADSKVIEVNTGRKPKEDGSQSAQDVPETAGGSTSSTPTTKAIDPDEATALVLARETLESGSALLKAIYGQLTAARAEIVSVRGERDAAIELAKSTIGGTQQLLLKLGELPIGRKTGYVEVTKEFADLSDIYDEDVRRILTKTK